MTDADDAPADEADRGLAGTQVGIHDHAVDPPRDPVAPADAADDQTDDQADDGAEDDAQQNKKSTLVWALEWVAVIGGAIVIALLVRSFLFTTFWIPSGSMEPTLMGEGRRDRVVVNRLAYQWGDPKRGDIIVFEVPEGEQTITVGGQVVHDLIKRVIGLPGETVELRDGKVYIDGELLDEPYLPDDVRTDPASPTATTFHVPDDAVFVLGDNRPDSRDARYWSTPYVPEDDIVGKAFVRIWPLSAFGGI